MKASLRRPKILFLSKKKKVFSLLWGGLRLILFLCFYFKSINVKCRSVLCESIKHNAFRNKYRISLLQENLNSINMQGSQYIWKILLFVLLFSKSLKNHTFQFQQIKTSMVKIIDYGYLVGTIKLTLYTATHEYVSTKE